MIDGFNDFYIIGLFTDWRHGFLVGDETLYPFTNTKVTNLDIVDIYKKYIETDYHFADTSDV